MKITFITPPSLNNERPAERTAGCTRILDPMPKIYELTVAAFLEKNGYDVKYKDFVYENSKKDSLIYFLENDNSHLARFLVEHHDYYMSKGMFWDEHNG